MTMETNSTWDHSADLRRAMMRVRPEYYSWPSAARERYGTSLPAEDEFRIRQTLLRSLFGIDVRTPRGMEEKVKSFTGEQHFALNSAILPLVGIGEDRFWLNEYLGEKTLLDFESLYDYDYYDYCFQEKANLDQLSDYIPRPYRGGLNWTWARLMIDGAFHYAFLSMAGAHVFHTFEDEGRELIRDLIPYEYVDGKNHGRRSGNGWIYDRVADAGGREPQFQELEHHYYHYLRDRWESLLDEFDRAVAGAVCIIDRSIGGIPEKYFVFTDKTALQHVRFRNFIDDCQGLPCGSSADLDQIADRERRAMTAFLRAAYQDILENFDPSVVMFRKKTEIRVLDGVLDDLL